MRSILTCAALLAVLATGAEAQVPRLISYQGYLTDAGGAPISGTRNLTLALYTVSAGGTALWTETHTSVPVTNGVFEVYLGVNSPLAPVAFDVPYWLGTKVNTDPELTPRTRLAAAPYALRSLTTQTPDTHWSVTATNDLIAGPNGNVGIGTSTPGHKVHVASTGPARLFLEADTNNSGESDNAGVRLSQDGGAVVGRVGYAAGLNKLEVVNEFADEIVFGTGNVTQLVLTPEAELQWRNPNGTFEVQIRPSAGTDQGGEILLRDNEAIPHVTLQLDGEAAQGEGSTAILYDHAGTTSIVIDAEEGVDGGALLQLYDFDGTRTIELDAQENPTDGADISLFRADGALGIQLDANFAGSGTSRIVTDVLQIQGGADLSENFEVSGLAGTPAVDGDLAGMVVSIDPDQPGALAVSDRAYDHRVAGIVSGAGDVRPGMLMGQPGTLADGARPVALTGRVWCLVDADRGAIEPGDLLTTSETPGHAMRARDHARSHGAILGKAMTALRSGRGLVLVLVSLQ